MSVFFAFLYLESFDCVSSVFAVGPGHILIAAYDERTCSQLRDVCSYFNVVNKLIFFRPC